MTDDAAKLRYLSELALKAEVSAARVASSATGGDAPVRHKCFVSYHLADIDAVTDFVERFSDVFIPRVLGTSDSDALNDPVDSDNSAYIMDEIGRKYLRDSTVLILFAGSCTWSRKFVDWEISSALRDSPLNKRMGLLGLQADSAGVRLPDRFTDNWTAGDSDSYGRLQVVPQSDEALRGYIEDAFTARTSRAGKVNNSRNLRVRNSKCP